MIKMGPVQSALEEKLHRHFNPKFLKVINESASHAVPEGAESHFRVELVSSLFSGLSRIHRSREVYSLLSKELGEGIHALSLKLFTPEEWESLGEDWDVPSPDCLGGSKVSSKKRS